MKLLKRTILSSLAIMFLTNFCPLAFAQRQARILLDPEKFLALSWEGVSLSMSPSAIYSTLERGGYTLLQEQTGRTGRSGLEKTYSTYRQETDVATNTFQIEEQGGVVTKIHFKEGKARKKAKPKRKLATDDYATRIRKKAERKKKAQSTQATDDKPSRIRGRAKRKKNVPSKQDTDDKFERIKKSFDLEDSACKPDYKGGGKCTVNFASDTHYNSLKVSVWSIGVQITLASDPLPAQTVERKKKLAKELDLAYSCFGTTDVNSVSEIFDCMQSSSIKLSQGSGGGKHEGIYLNSANLSCWRMTDVYKRALGHLKKDTSLIPDCKTFAAVIEHSTGKPPLWSGCVEPRNDAEFFKNCVAGYSPSLATPRGYYLPSCNALKNPYKKGVLGAQPDSKLRDVAVPDCGFMLAAAKTWRKELPDSLKGCDGYDPENTSEHIKKCLSSDRDVMYLRNCEHVRRAYKANVTKANGFMPEKFFEVPCEETEAVLARADEVREEMRKKAEEFERKLAEAKAKKDKARQDQIDAIKTRMATKYGDTPEGVKSRTSPLEKQIRANGGIIPKSCESPRVFGLYCPPTNEEIRLAMMRRHSEKTGFKMVNGHLLHGNRPTLLTFLSAMAGHGAKGTLGVELRYKDAQLIYKCDSKIKYYECVFRLPFETRYDELTKMYMDGLTSGSPFNINDFMMGLMDASVMAEDYSFQFRLDNSGLWRSEPTTVQRLEDLQDRMQSIDSKIR